LELQAQLHQAPERRRLVVVAGQGEAVQEGEGEVNQEEGEVVTREAVVVVTQEAVVVVTQEEAVKDSDRSSCPSSVTHSFINRRQHQEDRDPVEQEETEAEAQAQAQAGREGVELWATQDLSSWSPMSTESRSLLAPEVLSLVHK
jgi:cell envelope opacity-associated protein A